MVFAEETCSEDERTGEYSLAKEVVVLLESGHHAMNYHSVEEIYARLSSSVRNSPTMEPDSSALFIYCVKTSIRGSWLSTYSSNREPVGNYSLQTVFFHLQNQYSIQSNEFINV